MTSRLLILILLVTLLNYGCGTTTSASFVFRGSSSRTATDSETSVTTSGSPKSLVLNVQALYLSPNTDCTSMTPVTDLGEATLGFNLYVNPLMFSANPPQNTYKCLAIKMKDLIIARVNDNASNSWPDTCLKDTDYTKDLYPLTSSNTWKDIDGTALKGGGTETSPESNSITLFATTVPTAASSGSLGLSSTQVFSLPSAIMLPFKVTFYLDYTEGLDGTTTCQLSNGSMGFR